MLPQRGPQAWPLQLVQLPWPAGWRIYTSGYFLFVPADVVNIHARTDVVANKGGAEKTDQEPNTNLSS